MCQYKIQFQELAELRNKLQLFARLKINHHVFLCQCELCLFKSRSIVASCIMDVCEESKRRMFSVRSPVLYYRRRVGIRRRKCSIFFHNKWSQSRPTSWRAPYAMLACTWSPLKDILAPPAIANTTVTCPLPLRISNGLGYVSDHGSHFLPPCRSMGN